MFYTLQGEGAQSGRPAIFCRFTGCNLWNGLESGRSHAICRFCDTDFTGTDGQNGGAFTAKELVKQAVSLWPDQGINTYRYVVFTGGEPGLQLDEYLISLFKEAGFITAVESNGTLPLPHNLDWICISPKAYTELVVKEGHELKLIYPQTEATPEKYARLNFENFYLQPMDNIDREYNTKITVEYCLNNPQWKLSLQTHKILGID